MHVRFGEGAWETDGSNVARRPCPTQPKLRGAQKWTYYYVYVLLDVFSRYVVGWMIAPRESSVLAKELIQTSSQRQGIDQDGLVLHSDRGPSMTSKTVAQLLVDLGVEKSHSRPHVSNDNPYSEAQFKTMKYRGDYPDRFGSIEDARSWARGFFPWYNQEHHHTGLALMPPSVVHYGQAEAVRQARGEVLSVAYQAHPERFVRGLPQVPQVPDAVWINKPEGSSCPEDCGEILLGGVEVPSSRGHAASGVGERAGACSVQRRPTLVEAAEDEQRWGAGALPAPRH